MIELNYKSFGPIRQQAEQKTPIIILHGLFGMLDNWQSFGKKLAEENQVFLVDQRDHGRSPHTDAFSYPLLANDLRDFIEQHDLTKVNLIGHSMGGKTIMEFALSNPDLVDQMVVVDMGVKNYKGGHEQIFTALQALPINEIQSRKEASDFLDDYIENEGVRLFLMKNLARKTEGGYDWRINLPLLYESYRDLMDHNLIGRSAAEVDALFVRGGKSGYILEEDFEEIEGVFPKAVIKTVEDAGHWIHAEQPDLLHSMISTYFRQ